jgi:small subunit ribosomal protein S16
VAVTIRLRRTGTTKRPAYRVVVADSRSPRDGRFLEILGHYSPLTEPPTVSIDRAKVEAWIKKGAQPSNTVRKLIANAPEKVIASAPEKK